MSIRYSMKLIFMLGLLLGVAACSTTTLFVNSDLPTIADDAKFIVLPTGIHGLSGPKTEKEAVFYQSFKTAFGQQETSTPEIYQRLKSSGFSDISWKMSHAMHRLVTECDCFSYSDAYQAELDDGEAKSKFRNLDNELYTLSQWLKQEYQLASVPEYIVVAHIDSKGLSQAGKLIKYRVIAGIYSTQRQELERVVSYVTESPNDHGIILHDLDNLGFLIYRELFNA